MSTKSNIQGLYLFTVVGVLFFCMSIFSIYKEWQVARTFKLASCLIKDKHLSSGILRQRHQETTVYTPSVYLIYTIDQQTYQGWHRPSFHTISSSIKGPPTSELDRYSIGYNYPCWYDPNNPSSVILERNVFGAPIFFSGVSILFIVVGIFAIKQTKKQQKTNF